MKKRAIILFLFLFIIDNAAKDIAKKNANAINKFFKNQTSTIKILVLPFVNSQNKTDDMSDVIARDIASELQKKLQTKKNIVIYDKDGFDNPSQDNLKAYITETNHVYWKNLIEKLKPNFYIEGFYYVKKNSKNQEVLYLHNINLKTYFFDEELPLKKIDLCNQKNNI